MTEPTNRTEYRTGERYSLPDPRQDGRGGSGRRGCHPANRQRRNHNAEFIAALNRQRAELWEGHRRPTLLSLPGGGSLQNLDSQPEPSSSRGRTRLKAGGLYGVPLAAGKTEAEDIENEWKQAAMMRELSRSLY